MAHKVWDIALKNKMANSKIGFPLVVLIISSVTAMQLSILSPTALKISKENAITLHKETAVRVTLDITEFFPEVASQLILPSEIESVDISFGNADLMTLSPVDHWLSPHFGMQIDVDFSNAFGLEDPRKSNHSRNIALCELLNTLFPFSGEVFCISVKKMALFPKNLLLPSNFLSSDFLERRISKGQTGRLNLPIQHSMHLSKLNSFFRIDKTSQLGPIGKALAKRLVPLLLVC
jgi:hypothetical protein